MCIVLPCKKQTNNLHKNARLQSVINEMVNFPLLIKMNSAMLIFNSSGQGNLVAYIKKYLSNNVRVCP
jgi:hypothetical protein